jgi:diaminopimelate decarboxylase
VIVPPAVLAAVQRLDRLPAYVTDLGALRTHAGTVRDAVRSGGPSELYYAVKANPAPGVLAALRPVVDGFEVSSGGELRHVRALHPDVPIAFSGPGKTPDELRLALGAKVHRLHVESVRELRILAALGARTDLLLRVNPPIDVPGAVLAMGGRPSPFGLDPAELPACLALLREHPRLRLRGLHVHLASGLEADALLAGYRRVVAWARGSGVPFGELNLGGGMAVDYTAPQRRFDWDALGRGLAGLADGVTLRLEPGRSISAYCGWYVTEVLDVRRSHGRAFAVVRGGTHHLRTPAAKGHSQPFAVLPVEDWPHPWPRPEVAGEPVTVAGQLCTPKDVLARDVPLPRLRAGDRLAFGLAGAYGWNISHHEFLMHDPPRFVEVAAS